MVAAADGDRVGSAQRSRPYVPNDSVPESVSLELSVSVSLLRGAVGVGPVVGVRVGVAGVDIRPAVGVIGGVGVGLGGCIGFGDALGPGERRAGGEYDAVDKGWRAGHGQGRSDVAAVIVAVGGRVALEPSLGVAAVGVVVRLAVGFAPLVGT